MSLTFEVTVWCDGQKFGRDCSEWTEGSSSGLQANVSEARLMAASKSWYSGRLPHGNRSQKYDLCPACRSALFAPVEDAKKRVVEPEKAPPSLITGFGHYHDLRGSRCLCQKAKPKAQRKVHCERCGADGDTIPKPNAPCPDAPAEVG